MEYLKNGLYGLLIGVANAIPGVSGGTMAVILNVYDRIMFSISRTNLKQNLRFLIPLAVGAGVGIFARSQVIVTAMETYPVILNFCFIGLVVGSMPALYKKTKGAEGDKIKSSNWFAFAIALIVMIVMVFSNPDAVANQSLEEMGGVSAPLLIRICATSIICMIAMILPGLSGSLVMLLLGCDAVVMEAVATINLPILGAVGVGVIIGGVLGVKVIKNMLRFHPQALYCGILGLMVGSIFVIWPGFTGGIQMVIAVVGFAGFTLAAYLLSSRK